MGLPRIPSRPLADAGAGAGAGAVAPAPGDTLLTRWKDSAFVRTDLDRLPREQGRDQLVTTGVYAHIGVRVTTTDAVFAMLEGK